MNLAKITFEPTGDPEVFTVKTHDPIEGIHTLGTVAQMGSYWGARPEPDEVDAPVWYMPGFATRELACTWLQGVRFRRMVELDKRLGL